MHELKDYVAICVGCIYYNKKELPLTCPKSKLPCMLIKQNMLGDEDSLSKNKWNVNEDFLHFLAEYNDNEYNKTAEVKYFKLPIDCEYIDAELVKEMRQAFLDFKKQGLNEKLFLKTLIEDGLIIS